MPSMVPTGLRSANDGTSSNTYLKINAKLIIVAALPIVEKGTKSFRFRTQQISMDGTSKYNSIVRTFVSTL